MQGRGTVIQGQIYFSGRIHIKRIRVRVVSLCITETGHYAVDIFRSGTIVPSLNQIKVIRTCHCCRRFPQQCRSPCIDLVDFQFCNSIEVGRYFFQNALPLYLIIPSTPPQQYDYHNRQDWFPPARKYAHPSSVQRVWLISICLGSYYRHPTLACRTMF